MKKIIAKLKEIIYVVAEKIKHENVIYSDVRPRPMPTAWIRK